MIAKVDGYQVSADALWWPAMNSNQFNWDKPLGMYNLEIPRAAFCERLRSVYEQCAAELKADDVYDPDGVPHLREIGYPLLDVVLDHKRQFAELVTVFLYEDVFEKFLPALSSSARFMLNSVDDVSVSDSVVVVQGRGYHAIPGSIRHIDR